MLDKKAVEYLVTAFETSSINKNKTSDEPNAKIASTGPHSLVSIRLDDCSLRPGALDVLGIITWI